MTESNTIQPKCRKPLLGFAAWSGSDKTTLLLKLLPLMKLQGLRVAIIKQTHHDFEYEKLGTDSCRLKQAGADQMLIASDRRSVLVTEYRQPASAQLGELVNRFDLDNVDLVLVDGFKHSTFPRIELYRSTLGKPLMFPEDDSIIAVVSDVCIDTGTLPLLDINVAEEVAGFINRWLDSCCWQTDRGGAC